MFSGANSKLSTLNSQLERSHTLAYLSSREQIPVPQSRRSWNQYIGIKGARMNNLKGIDVKIPLNVLTVVTGVSGSGKSSLIKGILYPALKRGMGEVFDAPGEYRGLEGDTKPYNAWSLWTRILLASQHAQIQPPT